MKVISIYELLGLIKDGKAPKRIHTYVYNWVYDNNKDYINDFETKLFEDYLKNVISTTLNDEVEIIEPVEDEFIDIEEITSVENSPKEFYKFSKKINEIIKNQKKIIERLKEE